MEVNNMVKVYSNGCPKCNILKGELDKKGIKYRIESEDFEKLIAKSFVMLPVMELEDGSLLNFTESINHITKGEN